MARKERIDVGGEVYHILNRASSQLTIFKTDGDYLAFEKILAEAVDRFQMHLFSYCIMPNHWHMVIQPRKDGDMGRFVKWITVTHAGRHHTFNEIVGTGHLYQGRYKSFPVETDSYLVRLIRYVERNALRAFLVDKAEQWRWGSAWIRKSGTSKQKKMIFDWPIDVPVNYYKDLNADDESDEATEELATIRNSVQKSAPFGSLAWLGKIIDRFGESATIRPEGRPRRK